ncbi:related to DNA binding SART-1 [Lecanosticta acicola]|uniref:Related to DNA binding SART-1 n=1 Tax=Lecanosticta acicola TaxID=111012 RepID=A0AAI9EAA1_9PEZI|nr:related to DNA binding SART-1 [Lecanosticta acicola]
MASAADIEQMNKVRLSLGLAPLEVPGQGPQFKEKDNGSESDESDESDDLSTLEKRAAAAGSNWQKHEAERKAKEERQKRKEAAKKARDAAARFEKLEGKGLGEADDDGDVDARTWLKQQKKRQKKIEQARKLEEELAAREQQAEYTSRDLAGVKVGHEASEFDEFTGEQVLTLKDAAIGEESEDDELENADLRAKEKLEEKLRLKKKRPDYDPTEQGENQNVLSKYDEEIDGKKQKRFTLDGQGSTAEAAQTKAAESDEFKRKGVKISLDILKDEAPASDYVDPATIKVKKPKKSKKEKRSRQKLEDDDDIIIPAPQPVETSNGDDVMDVDGASTSRKRTLEFDDDDLQAKLAEQRRQALKKRKKTDASELARQLREEMAVDEPVPEDGGLIIDETSEFVANLKRPEEEEEERARKSAPSASPAVKDEDEDGDTNMNQQSYADVEDEEDRAARIKRETSTPADITATGLEEEETVTGQGVGAMMSMLRKRGFVGKDDSGALTEKEQKRAEFLETKKHLIEEYDRQAREQREADRQSGRFAKMSNRERDNLARQQNEQREQYISRLLADKFNKEYKPDVKLRYNDEYGREMNQKEAFKHLSHMFHGKGSGKQKTEKRLKKIEDEKKNAAKGILNVGEEGGFSNVQGREGKKQKTAGVRLQ